jgi:multimeric flavodoxin WrbA
MKILGLVASPRRLGNCEIIVSEMLRSLPDDFEKEMLRLPALAISDCKACYACLPSDKGCIIKDDLDFFLERIKQADCIIIASPCYFLGVHTSIKKICDRFISILNNASQFAGKKCVTVITYGIPGWEGYAREALMSFSRFLHLDHQGDLVIQAANPGESATEAILDKARMLAQRLLGTNGQEQDSTVLNLCPQ